jgi:hypothetical protein
MSVTDKGHWRCSSIPYRHKVKNINHPLVRHNDREPSQGFLEVTMIAMLVEDSITPDVGLEVM